jgi:hypothetical protein
VSLRVPSLSVSGGLAFCLPGRVSPDALPLLLSRCNSLYGARKLADPRGNGGVQLREETWSPTSTWSWSNKHGQCDCTLSQCNCNLQRIHKWCTTPLLPLCKPGTSSVALDRDQQQHNSHQADVCVSKVPADVAHQLSSTLMTNP